MGVQSAHRHVSVGSGLFVEVFNEDLRYEGATDSLVHEHEDRPHYRGVGVGVTQS